MCRNDDFASVRYLLDLSQPTLHTIAKRKEKIKEHVQSVRNSWTKVCT